MAGYVATSSSSLTLALGVQNLVTQSALNYLTGDTVQLTYADNLTAYMSGEVLAYNPVSGAMTVDISRVVGAQLQPVWNTQLWGSTGGIFTSWLLSLLEGVSTTTAAVTPSILVRNLGAGWDPQRGNGLANFLTDIDAVAQIIAQRLKLLKGEWFENLNLGLPLFQSILGVPNTNQAVSLLYRQQILGVPYVTDITSFNSQFNPASRQYAFSANVQTAFGPVAVTNVAS